MLRPVGMSHASVIFLKSDVEEAMSTLNSYGAFHLSLKEIEGQNPSQLIERAQDLGNRVKDLLGRAASILGDSPSDAGRGAPVVSQEWGALFDQIDSELGPYEKAVRSIESVVSRQRQSQSALQVWKAISAELDGMSGLDSLPEFKRLKLLFLAPKGGLEAKVEPELPKVALPVHRFAVGSVLLVACRSGDEAEVLHAAEESEFKQLDRIDGMPSRLGELAQFLAKFESDLQSESRQNEESIKSLRRIKPRIDYFSTILSDANAVLDIKNRSSIEKNWAMIEGYVPTKKVEPLNRALSESLGGRFIPFIKVERDAPQTPVTYHYPKFLRIFDSITNLYGTPSYNEINPTPILAVTFPLFFGLMFGDLGHGLALAAIGAFMYKKIKSMRSIGHVLMIAGLAGALVGGLLYGEVFGKAVSNYLPYYAPLHIPEGEAEFLSYLMQIIKLTLFIGIGQISLGMGLSIANTFIQRKWAEAFLVRVPKLLFYFALMYVVFTTRLEIMTWFDGPIYLILAPVLFLLLASPIYAMVKHGRREGLGHLGEMGFDLFETAIAFTSNTVSYLRIFAMVIAHIELMAVFYSLAAMTASAQFGFLFSGLLIVAGNIFVVLLEGILALAQDLRLHFYEWFSKFYQDSGVRFSPFRLALGVPISKKAAQ